MHVWWNYPPCIQRCNKEFLPFNTTLVLRGFIPGFSVTTVSPEHWRNDLFLYCQRAQVSAFRMREWQGLEGPSGDHLLQPPLPKQVPPEQAAEDRVQAGFEDLRRRRLHNASGHAVGVLRHLQSKEVLPRVFATKEHRKYVCAIWTGTQRWCPGFGWARASFPPRGCCVLGCVLEEC